MAWGNGGAPHNGQLGYRQCTAAAQHQVRPGISPSHIFYKGHDPHALLQQSPVAAAHILVVSRAGLVPDFNGAASGLHQATQRTGHHLVDWARTKAAAQYQQM
jgi:diadenosine tetraphosphate (Ap4A) HIT family hydrolase